MPKGGGKRNKGHNGHQRGSGGRTQQLETYSDDESLNDNASVVSIASSSVLDDGGEEVDEQTQEEAFEEKLLECVDALTEKSAQARTQALQAVASALSKKFLSDFVLDRYLTISDAVRLSLRRGNGAEKEAAAQLAPLLCVTLGATEQAEEVAAQLVPHLLLVAADTSASPNARAKCCWALSLLAFLTELEPTTAAKVERLLVDVFSQGEVGGQQAAVSPDMAALHAAALSGWTLLLTVVGDGHVASDRLVRLLASPHLEVRMAAGEALAVLHEAQPLEDDIEHVIELLSQLATDSSRFRGKKERKAQRSSFREIVAFMEEGRAPELRVRFGTEVLELETWASRKHYETFCQLLSSGLNLHLGHNELLRQVFDLGPPIPASATPATKASKLERHLVNAAAFKARTVSRAKHRDKRSAAIAC